MEGIWLAAFLGLWAIVLIQGLMLLFLYRQVGMHLLGQAESRTRDGLQVGKRAPGLPLLDVATQQTVRIAELRERPVLLVFAGMDCEPCLLLLPDLQRFAASQAAVEVWLSLSSSEDQARSFARHKRLKAMKILADDGEVLFRAFEARVTPYAFLVDREGVIRAKGLVNHLDHIKVILTQAGRGSEREGLAAAVQAASATVSEERFAGVSEILEEQSA